MSKSGIRAIEQKLQAAAPLSDVVPLPSVNAPATPTTSQQDETPILVSGSTPQQRYESALELYRQRQNVVTRAALHKALQEFLDETIGRVESHIQATQTTIAHDALISADDKKTLNEVLTLALSRLAQYKTDIDATTSLEHLRSQGKATLQYWAVVKQTLQQVNKRVIAARQHFLIMQSVGAFGMLDNKVAELQKLRKDVARVATSVQRYKQEVRLARQDNDGARKALERGSNADRLITSAKTHLLRATRLLKAAAQDMHAAAEK